MSKKYLLTWIFAIFCLVVSSVLSAKRDEIKCYFDNPQNCLNLGNRYFEQNQTQIAIKYFDKSCNLGGILACYNLGVIV